MLERVKAMIADDDLRGAMRLLNSLTGHRFTSVFRFDGDMLGSVVVYDRENPDADLSPEIPITASYCVFVRDAGETFRVEDSHRDTRVVGHPKQASVRSYCGVPLVDPLGRMFGTLCHFDFRPLPVSDADVALLEAAAELIPTLAPTT